MFPEESFSIYSFFSCSFYDLSMKWTVKFSHHLRPSELSLCDFIKLLFHIGCESIIHNISKILVQKVSYNHSNICWEHFLLFSSGRLLSFISRDDLFMKREFKIISLGSRAVFFDNIASFENCRNRRSIGRRSSDSLFFKLFYEACFGVSWRMRLELFCCKNSVFN